MVRNSISFYWKRTRYIATYLHFLFRFCIVWEYQNQHISCSPYQTTDSETTNTNFHSVRNHVKLEICSPPQLKTKQNEFLQFFFISFFFRNLIRKFVKTQAGLVASKLVVGSSEQQERRKLLEFGWESEQQCLYSKKG